MFGSGFAREEFRKLGVEIDQSFRDDLTFSRVGFKEGRLGESSDDVTDCRGSEVSSIIEETFEAMQDNGKDSRFHPRFHVSCIDVFIP